MDLVTGRIEIHPQGYGFVRPERQLDGAKGDIYVAGPNLSEAMHGDRVVVRVERAATDKRPEGRHRPHPRARAHPPSSAAS